jgi:lysine/arginine/ornithine transport system substrate-binding protein
MKTLRSILLISICFTISTVSYAKDWTNLRFGVDASYPPFESMGTDGKLVGFDIDLGNEICRRLKARCVWIENEFDGLIPGLKARKFDGVLSSMTITSQREEQIAFSTKLFKTPARLVARKGTSLAPSLASLKGKTVGVGQGTTQESYAKENWAAHGVSIISYQHQDQVYSDLVSGRLDATLQDEIQAQLGFLNTPRGGNFAFAGPEIPMGVSAVGLRKEDTDLKALIDKAIIDMFNDGTYKKIESKYFDVDVYGN